MFGARAFGRPALVEEPGFGRVAEIFADFVEGFARNEADFFVKAREFGGLELSAEALGGESGAPEDFVSHPIADTGKTFLM